MSEAEQLLGTRAGLALANAAYNEGVQHTLNAVNESEKTGVFTKPESPYLHEWAQAKARADEYTPTVQSLIDHYRELSTTVSGDETVGEQNAEIAHRVITTAIVDAIREYANRLTQPGSTPESENTP